MLLLLAVSALMILFCVEKLASISGGFFRDNSSLSARKGLRAAIVKRRARERWDLLELINSWMAEGLQNYSRPEPWEQMSTSLL